MSKIKVVHYINQFFAGLGGEEMANEGPGAKDGATGPGQALQLALGDMAEVVATVYCGDNYINENPDSATDKIVDYVSKYQPDVVMAGPAFNAGRYGIACGRVCIAVQERLKVPAVSGMYHENPAVEIYRSQLYIVPTGATAASMAEAFSGMARLAIRLAQGERIGVPTEEGYIPRGLRFTEMSSTSAAERALDMLLRRLKNQEFQTEWPVPQYDRVTPPAAVKELGEATIALVTTGGIVPKNNPDKLESTFATKWLKCNISALPDLTSGEWDAIHGGYDTTYAGDDPDRVLPLDVMREFETEGTIG